MQNGACHLILAIVLIFGCAAEIVNRIEIRESYNGYKNYENHPDPNAIIGAKMLASCGSKKKDYEAILGSRLVMERDELNVCQAWYAFIAGIVSNIVISPIFNETETRFGPSGDGRIERLAILYHLPYPLLFLEEKIQR